MFVVTAGLIVVPTDLYLAGVRGRLITAAVCAGVLASAVFMYVAMRAAGHKLGAKRSRRIGNVVTCLCAAVILASGIALLRSPLFDPAAYQVPQAPPVRDAAGRPNVLWIVLDTVRADRLSCYGFSTRTTPFLEEWAAKSLVFDRAITNGIWTVPSHASMFTGRSVRAHGVDYPDHWLDDDILTVADALRASGYSTAAFSNNPWISPDTNLTKGFEEYYNPYNIGRMGRFSLEYLCTKWGITPIVPWINPDWGAGVTKYLLGRWLDATGERADPVFVFVNYMEAHLPYRIPKSYREMYLTDKEVDRSYDLRWRLHGNLHRALNKRFSIQGGDFLLPADREILKRQYLAAIRYLDDRLREIIELFEQRGLLDNTLVVITGDHGEYLDTHGMWSHVFLTYQDLVHVPLREPGRQEGLRVAAPVQLSDLYATVMNAALGTSQASPGFGSRDLISLARSGGPPRVAVTEYGGPDHDWIPEMRQQGDPEVDHRIQPQLAIQDQRFKYIISNDGRGELYDLAADPGELHNLLEAHPAKAQQLARQLQEWLEAVPKYQSARSQAAPELSPEVLEQLRSLGYVDD
jgi:arylsulfatase A-like enzyme